MRAKKIRSEEDNIEKEERENLSEGKKKGEKGFIYM